MGDDDLFFALNSHYPLLLKSYLFLDSILSKVQSYRKPKILETTLCVVSNILGFLSQQYQFTKVSSYFCDLKTKPSKGFKNTKWLRHFVFGYKTSKSYKQKHFSICDRLISTKADTIQRRLEYL